MPPSARKATPRVRASSGAVHEVKISLADVADPVLLKSHWKRIRKDLRAPRVNRFLVASDPLDWMHFEWRIDDHLAALREAVVGGTYRAGQPEQVRAAKSLGLTRPTAFFAPEDMLLYRNIVASADTDLMRSMRPWTRFGRTDAKNAEAEPDPESGWFRAWLTRMGQLWTITESHEWIVETDISNFFPSVQLDAIASHVLASSRLGVEVVRLLTHILRESAIVPEYRVSPVVGLPQESFDCSRILAHSFLHTVDDEFAQEGENGRYSRYMDDIVIGADTKEDGYRFISRAQRALEALGLYPNKAKTRVIKREDFARELMKDENDRLGELTEQLKLGHGINTRAYRRELRRHLDLRDRPQAWERVLRRHYTLCRTLRDQTLIDYCAEHIGELPGSARPILDYLATFLMTKSRVGPVIAAVDAVGDLYEDITLLTLQYLATAPNVRSQGLMTTLSTWSFDLAERRQSDNPRVAAAALVVAGKFGDAVTLDRMATWLLGAKPVKADLLRRQLSTILVGAGRLTAVQLARLGSESVPARRSSDFLEAVMAGDAKALGMCLDAMAPRERKEPRIFMIPPRPMFLAPLVLPLSAKRGEASKRSWTAKVRLSEGPRDRVGEDWLGLGRP
jgi:hypothetical protein